MSSSTSNAGLISFIVCFASLVVFAESKQGRYSKVRGCSDYCEDYHRVCPGVKDRKFYEKYMTMHAEKQLGHFQNAPLPPSPDCSNVFYQLACPYSCGKCTRCECCDKDDPNKKKLECNPCTEVKQVIRNDVFICKPRYELVHGPAIGPCSCYCGTGTVEVEMLCKTFYEASDGSCFEEISKDASKCDNKDMRGTQSCKDRDCEVTKIVEQTLPGDLAGFLKNESIHYEGTTEDGQVCDIGDIGGQMRPKEGTTMWDLSVKCDVCLRSEKEGFRNLTLSNDDEKDSWDPEFLKVTFNGNRQIFVPRYPVNPYEGKRLKKGKLIPFVTKGEFDQLEAAGEIKAPKP